MIYADYTHTHTHTQRHTHASTQAQKHACTYARTTTHMHTNMHTITRAHTHMYASTLPRTHTNTQHINQHSHSVLLHSNIWTLAMLCVNSYTNKDHWIEKERGRETMECMVFFLRTLVSLDSFIICGPALQPPGKSFMLGWWSGTLTSCWFSGNKINSRIWRETHGSIPYWTRFWGVCVRVRVHVCGWACVRASRCVCLRACVHVSSVCISMSLYLSSLCQPS